MAKHKSGPKRKKDEEKIVSTHLELNYKIDQKFHLSERQKTFLELVNKESTNIIFCDGPAGSSKTYLTVLVALEMLKLKKINEIIYVRSIVESASKSLGSLPGEVENKFLPWIMPLLDKCDELIPAYTTDDLLKNEYIKCIPVNYLRGATFKDCVVIVDESQNLTKSEIKTVISRYGKNCKMFIIGDSFQKDIKDSGFQQYYNAFNSPESELQGIYCNKFEKEDIVRSKLLRYIINVIETKITY